MKRVFSAFLAVLFVTFSLPSAADGFSVGASAARTKVDVNEPGMTVNGDATGWRVFGGYMITRNFGVEAGYSSFGRPDDNSLASNLEVDTEGVDLYAVGRYSVSEKFNFFGKVGFVRWDTSVEEDELSEVSTDSTDLALGFGGQYDLNERFAIRGEAEWFDSADSGGVNMLALSGVFRF
jgi:OOP family OmpA-OmpF porin